tara:strand:- start:374 stop:1744 length:1371 start_codon:yes stop_codon:yes gene_type:complete
MGNNPTQALAEMVLSDTITTNLRDVEIRARDLLLDYFGVLIGGSVEPVGHVMGRYAETDSSQEASVYLKNRSSSAVAAMANGMAAHTLELDDVTNESSLHPGVVVWPAAMAVVERRNGTLADLLSAGVAGYEVVMRVGEALNAESVYARGFHPTGVAGVFGATAAAGRSLGLGSEQIQHAFGLAGSMAAGSMAYSQNGSDGKRLNAGWAAHAGVIAADLASLGVSGPVDVLSGAYGVLSAYSDKSDYRALDSDDELVRAPRLLEVAIKPYACCRYIHPVIDACRILHADESFGPSDVERLRISILPGGGPVIAEPVDRKRRPENRVDAQFSVYYGAAFTLSRGAPGVDAFEGRYLNDPVIQRLADRVELFHDPELDARYPKRWGCRMEAHLSDGGKRAVVVEDPRGDARRPLVSDEVDAKFLSLALPVDSRLAEKTLSWVRGASMESSLISLGEDL